MVRRQRVTGGDAVDSLVGGKRKGSSDKMLRFKWMKGCEESREILVVKTDKFSARPMKRPSIWKGCFLERVEGLYIIKLVAFRP